MQNRLRACRAWHLAGTVAVTKMNAATTTIEAMINRAEKYVTFDLPTRAAEEVKLPVVRSVRLSASSPPSATRMDRVVLPIASGEEYKRLQLSR